MRKWGFLILVVLLIACKSKEDEGKIIPKRDFVNLLVDLHIADAIAMNHIINENFGKLDSAILYKTVLDKYGYTREQMENSMKYYSGESEKLVEIYDDVFSTLSKRSDEAKENYNKTSVSRTHRIWKAQKNRYGIFGDSLQYPPPFDIPVDSTGTFVLSVNIRMTENDSSVNPRIEAYFYDPDNDTPDSRVYFDEVSILKGGYTREYTLIQELKDPDLRNMRIILPKQDNPDSVFSKALEIRNLLVSMMLPEK